jgi:hypothetical protein
MIMIIELKLLYVRRVPLACRARLLLGSRNVPCAATSVLCCWSVARCGVRAPCTCRRALLLVGRVVKLIVNMYNYDVLCCWRLSRAAGAPTRLSGGLPRARGACGRECYDVQCLLLLRSLTRARGRCIVHAFVGEPAVARVRGCHGWFGWPLALGRRSRTQCAGRWPARALPPGAVLAAVWPLARAADS